ncbi:aldo/keto reductase [Anderseniella sp. Alg231-50]|uniref:aldo/keto reductase n=1 Tax=Anderseniella sp. Alg231-50 TaxID=1922226 RepID=UPI000D55C0E7
MKIVSANGADIPAIGLGTWELRGEQCTQLVETALQGGYTHIDTAQMYQNEREVGAGIRASGMNRDNLFVTTKIWPENYATDDFARAADERLEFLDCGTLDLLLLHWPPQAVSMAEAVAGLNKAKRTGLARHIGISNFTVQQVEEAVALSDEPLVCNQIEYHPLINQDKVRAACARHGLAVTAYCPIARNQVADEPVMRDIALRHDASPAQIALAWLAGHGDVISIPRSSRPERLADNLKAMRISLSEDEMAEIGALTARDLRLVDPESVRPRWDTA